MTCRGDCGTRTTHGAGSVAMSEELNEPASRAYLNQNSYLIPGLTPGATHLRPSSMAGCAVLADARQLEGIERRD